MRAEKRGRASARPMKGRRRSFAEEMAMSVMEELRTEQPMLNMNHNLIHTLAKKLDALSRYDIYIQDAVDQGCEDCANVFRRFKEEEMRHMQVLRDEISLHCREGRWQ